MQLQEEYSFDKAIENFYEDADVEKKASEIIENAKANQTSLYQDGLKRPFISLAYCTKEEQIILEKSYRQKLERNCFRKASEVNHSCEAQIPYYTVPRPYPNAGNLATQIKRLLNRGNKSSEANVYDLAHLVLSQVKLVNYNGAFYYFDGSVFKFVNDQDLRSLIFPILEPAIAAGKNARIISQVVEMLRDIPYIRVSETSDSSDRVFFLNGAYSLAKHELTPVGPSDFFTSYITVNYTQANSICPQFDAYLETVSGGDYAIKTLIWEVLGYLLVPDMSAKSFFVLQGIGDTGKSVFGNLVSSFFNQESLSYIDIYRFKDRFSTSVLKGKRLNICMDLPRAQISREAIGTIKMITGDDIITVEEKFHGAEPYKPTCKLLFGSNFPLMPADNDAAFRARLVTIPFLYPIPKEQQDKKLLEKLMAERSAIAVKALEAYQCLKARNYQFTVVENIVAVNGYIPDSELMAAFLQNCCVFDPMGYIFSVDLQDAYNAFRALHNAPPILDTAIFSRQFNRYCAGQVVSKRARRNDQNLNGYKGIRLLERNHES